MLNGFINVSKMNDLTGDIIKSLKELENKNVCIGIPQESNVSRGKIKQAELLYIQTHGVRNASMINEMNEDMETTADGTPYSPQYNEFTDNMEKGMPYSAAYQLYVSSFGSPLWNIPPRPVIEPAIENSKSEIAEKMKDVASTALEGKSIDTKLEAVGMLGQNVTREWFVNPSNEWTKNSPITAKRKGSDRPLIDKGELRKSIIYVIKDGSSND